MEMDRRIFLGGIAAVTAPKLAAAQEVPHWPSPVIDMHFHMRQAPAANIAHQQGAGVTAANLLTRNDAAAAVAGLQAQNPKMFPCWFGSTDVSKPDAEQLLTQAVKSGAKCFGELKFPVARMDRRCAGSMTWRRR
jgi:hypothetical protein